MATRLQMKSSSRRNARQRCTSKLISRGLMITGRRHMDEVVLRLAGFWKRRGRGHAPLRPLAESRRLNSAFANYSCLIIDHMCDTVL